MTEWKEWWSAVLEIQAACRFSLPFRGGNEHHCYASGAKMTSHIRVLLLVREFLVVATSSVGMFLLSTSGLWGISLGLALIFAALLVSTTLRVRPQSKGGRGPKLSIGGGV